MKIYTYRVEDSNDYDPSWDPRETLFVLQSPDGRDVFASAHRDTIKRMCESHNRRLRYKLTFDTKK